MKTIAIIGAGHLGISIIDLVKNKFNIIASRTNLDKLKELQKRYPNIKTTNNNREATVQADIIILTTKEKHYEQVSAEIRSVRNNKLLISLGPVCKFPKLSKLFGDRNIRVMTPVDPGEDLVSFAVDNYCTINDEDIVREIFPTAIKLSELQLGVATSYTLIRGILNLYYEPLVQMGIENGLDIKTARKFIGNMLISAGNEIKLGISAEQRLLKSSGGMNKESYTLKLYSDIIPGIQLMERIIKEANKAFK